MRKIAFLKELEDINLSDMLHGHVDELAEYNNYEWEFVLDKPEDVAKVFNEIIEECIDFWNTDYVTRYGSVYWSGCLTAEPWCDLDECEEVLLNILLKKHTTIVVENEQILMRFVMNEESEINKFLIKHGDGYGGNIAYSVNGMRRIVVKTLFTMIKERNNVLERIGSWHEAVHETEEDWWI